MMWQKLQLVKSVEFNKIIVLSMDLHMYLILESDSACVKILNAIFKMGLRLDLVSNGKWIPPLQNYVHVDGDLSCNWSFLARKVFTHHGNLDCGCC